MFDYRGRLNSLGTFPLLPGQDQVEDYLTCSDLGVTEYFG